MDGLTRVELRAPVEIEDSVVLYLTRNAQHGWEEVPGPAGILFRVHFEPGPSTDNVIRELPRRFPKAEMKIDEVEHENWNAAWREFFEPVRIGPDLTVVPPWLAGKFEGLEIVIDPAMAFGTGHHATTRLCLRALLELRAGGGLYEYEKFLDLGSGSGILAIAAAKMGLSGIGLDIDPTAAENAGLNIRINECGNRILLAAGGIDALQPEPAFDLVMANILAGVLKDLAQAISSRVRPGGSLILSGILNEQADSVIAAYEKEGLRNPAVMREGEWTALVYIRIN